MEGPVPTQHDFTEYIYIIGKAFTEHLFPDYEGRKESMHSSWGGLGYCIWESYSTEQSHFAIGMVGRGMQAQGSIQGSV